MKTLFAAAAALVGHDMSVPEGTPMNGTIRGDGQIELGGYEGLPNGTAWVYTKGYIALS